MKWNILVSSLVLGLAVCTQSFGFELLDRMLLFIALAAVVALTAAVVILTNDNDQAASASKASPGRIQGDGMERFVIARTHPCECVTERAGRG